MSIAYQFQTAHGAVASPYDIAVGSVVFDTDPDSIYVTTRNIGRYENAEVKRIYVTPPTETFGSKHTLLIIF